MEMPFERVGLDGHFFGGHMSNLIKKIVFVQFLYKVELPICCVGSCSDIGSNGEWRNPQLKYIAVIMEE